MLNSNSKNNFKVLAIGCAAVLICASAQMFASSYNSVYAETVSVNKTVTCSDEDNHTIKGLKPFDLVGANGTLKTITCTFKTSTGEIPTDFSGAYGVAVSLDCPDATDEYWYQADTVEFDSTTIKDNGDGTFSVTYSVPTSIQKYINYTEEWGNLEIGCYYCNIDSVTLVSVSDSASSVTPTPGTPSTPSTPSNPSTPSGTTISSTYEVKDNEDGTNTGVIHIDTTGLSTDTVTVTFTGGTPGATTSGEVGYYDSTTQKWVGKYDEWEEQKFDDNGNLTLSLKVPKDVEDVQIMLTYYADWSSGTESLLNKNSVKATVTTSGTVNPNPNPNPNPNTPTYDMPENAQCGWTDITSGTTATNSSNLISSSSATGTKTVTITQGGQWSSYDEGNEAIILDQTYEAPLDENGNEIYDTDSGNDVITNSNNFMFVDDFSIPSNAEFNHFRFTFESDEPMYQVQFGAGISVEKESEIANSGSTDTNGNLSKIWFNESGTYDPSNEDDYASLENSNGKKYYGLNTLDTYSGGTNYIQAQWDVYEDVKPYIQNDAWSSVSVQYWYGVDPADWDSIDWENPPENPDIEHKPTQIKVTEATANYNITETYDYTDTATKSVNLEAFGDMTGVKFSDLGLTAEDKPKAVTITVSGASDLGKLVGAFGVSVTDDYPNVDDLESANWYQSSNLVYEDCGSTYEITWIIPSTISDYVNPEYDAEIKFGAWYAGAGENALDSVTITNISVDYYTEVEDTTTPAVTTTPTPTTTTPTPTTTTTVDTTTSAPDTTTTTTSSGSDTEPLWGDVNVDGFVKSNDLLLLKKYLLGLDDVSEQGLINADVTHDTPSAVKSNDLLKLKKFLLGLIDDLGPGSEN